MMRPTRLLGCLGLLATLGVPDGSVAAQDEGGPDLEQLRTLIPDRVTGPYDVAAAETMFGQLAEAYGASPAAGAFGDGSGLTGPCGGFAYSYDEDGGLLDAAADFGNDNPPVDLLDGGQAFTSGNRFTVDSRGTVVYYGFMPRNGEGPRGYEWSIKTSGVSVRSGGGTNAPAENRRSGVADLADELPVRISANVELDAELTSANIGSCAGEGQVELTGNGLADPVGIAAIALAVLGALGLLLTARPTMTWRDD